jgi:arsenate reductase
MSDPIYNVLFLCTGNSARSILGEAILNHEGAGKFRGFSAGSQPKGAVHPLSLSVLADMGYPTAGLRSKSWDEFAKADAPKMDFIFTVCDNAAGEVCPLWPGQPMTAHWGLEDPAAVEGSDVEKKLAFVQAAKFMRNRIAIFVNLPLKSLDHLSLRNRLNSIGAMEGATSKRQDA